MAKDGKYKSMQAVPATHARVKRMALWGDVTVCVALAICVEAMGKDEFVKLAKKRGKR